MLIRNRPKIPGSEITPRELYLNRRQLIGRAATAAAGAMASGPFRLLGRPEIALAGQKLHYVKNDLSTTGRQLTPIKEITGYNNFYEFGSDKGDPARFAHRLRTEPWTVAIEGQVKKPRTYDAEGILRMHPSLEERVYRLRCVEAWSMVIPWIGIPLRSVIKAVEPSSKAEFMAFETVYAPDQMPGQRRNVLLWPYVEGLRMDEATHPLTILSVGLYGESLLNQNGAPLRLLVPWKYGFKSIKSIVKIRFVESQPPPTWNLSAPREYGFCSNVNPRVSHPRWSQAKERRIGDFFKRDTLMFNGYADQVAGLYQGMDLEKYF